MTYTILDLLDQLILLEENGKKMYQHMVEINTTNNKIQMISKILAKEEERHIECYKELKDQMKDASEEIDFDIYDKIYSLIHKFKLYMTPTDTQDRNRLLEFALDFEKQNVALLIDIQGRMVRKEKDSQTYVYKALSEIIEEEKNHVNNLESFI